jgi:hypothetical protein
LPTNWNRGKTREGEWKGKEKEERRRRREGDEEWRL